MTEKLLVYALGRGLDHQDMPVVRSVLRTAAAQDYRFSSLILGVVDSVPFQMRMKHGGAVTAYVHHQEILAPANVPARRGCDGGPAAARRDGPGAHRSIEDSGEAADAVRSRVRAERRHHGAMDSIDARRRFRVHADPEAAGGVSGSVGRGQQSDPSQSRSRGRRSRDQRRGIAHRCVPEENRGGRRQCWRVDRSARRKADRSGHAVPVARAGDGGFHRLHRGVHERVQLRATSTRSRGARRRPRCRWRSTRAWCSSGCSVVPARRSSAQARRRRNLSILDVIAGQAGDLQRGLGARDRTRLDEYLQNIREIERGFSVPRRTTAAT